MAVYKRWHEVKNADVQNSFSRSGIITALHLLQSALFRGAGEEKVLRLNGKQVKFDFFRPVLPPQR